MEAHEIHSWEEVTNCKAFRQFSLLLNITHVLSKRLQRTIVRLLTYVVSLSSIFISFINKMNSIKVAPIMYYSKKFLECVKNFLAEHTGDVYEIVKDKDVLKRFGVVWNISMPIDYRAKGYIRGVSENHNHEVVIYPPLSFDLQGAAFDLDGADL